MTKRRISPPRPARGEASAPRSVRPEELRLRLRIPSTRAAIQEAVRTVMKAAAELRCSRSQRADVEIALREALANAVFHGNRGDASKKVSLRCVLSREKGMVVAVRDEGAGFDPSEVPDPRTADRLFLHHGRGLLLMRGLMDRIEHRLGGREVVLYKEPCARGASGARRR